jgi:hypothetical protein
MAGNGTRRAGIARRSKRFVPGNSLSGGPPAVVSDSSQTTLSPAGSARPTTRDGSGGEGTGGTIPHPSFVLNGYTSLSRCNAHGRLPAR